ncbi:MAG: hypothetical protein ACLQVI_16265 [Polyangiaceae bacterium]
MSLSPQFGFAATGLILGIAGWAAVGCSSPTHGAGSDAGNSPPSEDAGALVGAPCETNADCPSGAECSNVVYGAATPLYPTAICVAPCSPPPASEGIGACGGDSVPGAGLCQPASGSIPALCVPFCEVTSAGTVAGCEADDVCQLLGSDGTDGAGWCQPGCTANSQCPSGTQCDPLLAACVTTPLATSLPIGAPCSLVANPAPCNCVGIANEDGGAAEGYCTAACVTGASVCPSAPSSGSGDSGAAALDGGDAGGGSPSPVPWVCSAELNLVTTEDGGIIFTTQPPGLYGFCTPPCNSNADCASFQGRCSQGDPAAPAGFTGTCISGS